MNDWDRKYAEGNTPWDTKHADPAVMNQIGSLGKSGKCLELGCGTGNEAIAISKLGFEVTAYDISRVAIVEARRRAKNVEGVQFHVRDVLKVKSKRKFDLILDKACFHFIKPGKRNFYAKNVRSMLKDDGYFILLAASEIEKTSGPYTFTKGALRRTFSKCFKILSIRRVLLKTHREKRTPYMCLMTKKVVE